MLHAVLSYTIRPKLHLELHDYHNLKSLSKYNCDQVSHSSQSGGKRGGGVRGRKAGGCKPSAAHGFGMEDLVQLQNTQ